MIKRSRVMAFVAAVLAIPVVLSPGGVAHATDPVPAAVAVPADDGPHPGATTEWWYASVQNPATGETFIANFGSAPTPETTSFWYDRFGTKTHMHSLTEPYTTTSQPSVSNSAGTLVYDTALQAYHLIYHANGITADIWYDTDVRPGITGGPINYNGQSMYWTNPVATSKVHGWVWPAGQPAPISVDNWKGYHDHNWGAFNLDNQTYRGWEWAVSHHPDGSVWVLGGVVEGNGTYTGFLVKANSSGTTFCQNTVTLSNWATIDGFAYPRTLAGSCPGAPYLSQTFTVTGAHKVPFVGFDFTESVGKTVTGSIGAIEHFRTWAYAGT